MSVRRFLVAASVSTLVLLGLTVGPAGAVSVSQCSGAQPVSSSGTPGPVGAEVANSTTLFAVCAGGIVGADGLFAETCSVYTGCGSSGGVELFVGSSTIPVAGYTVLYTYCLLHGQVGGFAVSVLGTQYPVVCLP
jgi:hypothetical protein